MNWSAVGAGLLALAVGLGAFGAHGLRGRLDEYAMGVYEKAVFYHFVHALGILVVGRWRELGAAGGRICGLLGVGVGLFSGSLYLLAVTGERGWGAVAPVGGVAFLVGWGWLAVAAGRGGAVGCVGLLGVVSLWAGDWPQAGGPAGTWTVTGAEPPVRWSVVRNENIAWRRELVNGGQSGIAVARGRLFFTTFAKGEKGFSGRVTGWAVEAKTGRTLWSVELAGVEKSPMLYAYSDATTPTPVTDGRRVWFWNASGEMGCWDWEGREVWRRQWKPWGKPFPFNKQFEPMMSGDLIYNVEPGEREGWNYLRAIDKKTGRVVWTNEDGTTTYNTPRLGRTREGRVAILHGRGGWHDVPEGPVGLSLTDARTGRSLWRFVAGEGTEGAPTWQALYVMHWDARYAYWFRMNPEESHVVIDAGTGRLVKEQSLVRGVDYRRWNREAGRYELLAGVNLREVGDGRPLGEGEVIRVQPAWHANVVVGGYHYFLASTGHRRNRKPPKGRAGPAYCVGRVGVETGKVEYLELPVGVDDGGRRIYGEALRAETKNAAGEEVATEERSRMDGWETPAFWGSPVGINGKVYFTTSVGTVYVLDGGAKVLDERAILGVNDLGALGRTWSQNSVSFDGRRLYHRTAKELIAIGR